MVTGGTPCLLHVKQDTRNASPLLSCYLFVWSLVPAGVLGPWLLDGHSGKRELEQVLREGGRRVVVNFECWLRGILMSSLPVVLPCLPIPAGAAWCQGAGGAAATCKQPSLGHTRAEGLFSTVSRISV